MNFEYLNKMIEYIEENLTEKIEYKQLARIVGISEHSLQSIFLFLTNISISEYIRKRRLSRAFEELRNGNIKIIDLAIKYQYESDISFTRAFKKMFGITPSECKKDNKQYILFPIAKFTNDNLIKELKYEIVKVQAKQLYCLKIENTVYKDYLYEIRETYRNMNDAELYNKMKKRGMYGVSVLEDNKYKYFFGSETKFKDSIKLLIPEGNYIVFNIGSIQQDDIVAMFKLIYSQWIPSTSYKVDMNFTFEFYENENCFLYLPLK